MRGADDRSPHDGSPPPGWSNQVRIKASPQPGLAHLMPDKICWFGVFFPLLKTRPVMASLWVKGLQRINKCPYAADTVFASVHYHQKQSAVRWVQL